MSDRHFADRLLESIESKMSHVVVGLDPDVALLPPSLKAEYLPGEPAEPGPGEVAACYRAFLGALIGAVCDEVVAVKPQIAYFEALGAAGFSLYEDVVGLAKSAGLLVIGDVKRGDIGSTAEAYARAHLEVVGVDAVTLNPYLGTESVEPFLTRARTSGKGLFVLVKTSNPSSAEIQDMRLASGESVYERVADLVNVWGQGTEGSRGYRSVGAVVGGTYPSQGAELRRRMPGVPLLVPGYGAQVGKADDLKLMFDQAGTGAVINSSRAILYAYRKRGGDWLDAAVAETREMKAALWAAAGRA
ncbi:MAG TPA: orotidine-5'-phosphate decarboxylase [Thermoleophilia bacterium]|nr:orotidine-5'-phosphate decarboxylase [Thermoleophilia bacterium]